jgi:hypothetical protein
MRHYYFASTAVWLTLLLLPAAAQQQLPRPGQSAQPSAPSPTQAPPSGGPQQAAPQFAPVKPYKPVAVAVPATISDPSLEAFRKQVIAAAQRKDRAALAKLVVAKGFFWESPDGRGADAKKSGIDNLADAIGLDAKDGSGWEVLSGMAADANAAVDPQHKGVVCAPPVPNIDDRAFQALIQATGTDPSEWGYPNAPGLDVRQAGQDSAPVIEKLGMHLVRVLADQPATPLAAVGGYIRIATPSGKAGFIRNDAIMSLLSDQLCYAKEAGGWRIAGVVGGAGGGEQ